MRVVAGLGNPGAEYAWTPHNLGFLVVDRLALRHGIRVTRTDSKAHMGVGEIAGVEVMLAKPQTFMNLSGTSLGPLLSKHGVEPESLILIYDDLDLPWQSIKVKARGSAGGHHGVEDVIRVLGTKDFPRVRMGIDPGVPVRKGAEFVLARFPRSVEKDVELFVDLAADAVTSIIAEGVEKSMAKFNRRAQG